MPNGTLANVPYADTFEKFAHESERDWARQFDKHNISWQYEPFLLPLTWSPKGKILSAFCPDFYLHEYGLFVEVTVMKQPLTTRKRGKVKRAMATYPGMRIKLMTVRDHYRCCVLEEFDPEVDLTV